MLIVKPYIHWIKVIKGNKKTVLQSVLTGQGEREGEREGKTEEEREGEREG